MAKSNFKNDIYKRNKQQDRQRKFDVIAMKKEGYTNDYISSTLNIPEVTVEKYLKDRNLNK